MGVPVLTDILEPVMSSLVINVIILALPVLDQRLHAILVREPIELPVPLVIVILDTMMMEFLLIVFVKI